VSPQEMYLTSSLPNFDFSEELLTGEWQPTVKYVAYGYIQPKSYKDNENIQTVFPSVVFTLDFKNEDVRNFIILYLPLFLLFLLIFTSLLTKVTDIGTRFPVVAGVIPILALHSLVIESISPTTSNMTKIDLLYLSLVMLALLILLFQAYVGLRVKALPTISQEEIEKRTTRLKLANDVIILSVLAILISVITYTSFS